MDISFEDRNNQLLLLRTSKIPVLNELFDFLKKYGITFKEYEYKFNNVILKKGDQEEKFSAELFYRYSGRCAYLATEKNGDEIVKEMTDKQFYDWFKMIILISFKIDKI
jgi:hypothetical protein